MLRSRKAIIKFILLFLLLTSVSAFANPDSETVKSAEQLAEELQTNLNIVWTCVAAFLVFFMQAGFAMVEAGFTRAKNAINILMKNLMDFSIGTLAFFFVGFGLMFGLSNGFFGTTNFMMIGTDVAGKDWRRAGSGDQLGDPVAVQVAAAHPHSIMI